MTDYIRKWREHYLCVHLLSRVDERARGSVFTEVCPSTSVLNSEFTELSGRRLLC